MPGTSDRSGSGRACPFCPVAGGEPGPVVVFGDDLVLVLMDRYPVAPGHLLVVPRIHRDSVRTATDRELGRIAVVSRAAAGALRRALGCDGVSIVVQDGEAASQAIEHVHWHVVPRWTGDGLHADDGDRTTFTYRHAKVPRWVLEDRAQGIRAAIARELEEASR